MTSLRDARAAAIRRRLSDLSADTGRWLPVLLDDLETLDEQALPGLIRPAVMTDDEAAAFAARWLAESGPPVACRYEVGGVIYEAADVRIIRPVDAAPAPAKPARARRPKTGGAAT